MQFLKDLGGRFKRVATNRKTQLVAGVGALALIGSLGGGAAATAAGTVVPSNDTVTSAKVVNLSLYGGDLANNTIAEGKLGYDFRTKVNAGIKTANDAKTAAAKAQADATAALNQPGTKGDKGEPGTNGTQGAKGDKGDAGDPASDIKGSVVVDKTFDPTVVVNIGGTFSTKATLVGKVTLPAGKLKIDADGFWTTNATGPAGTRVQLALRAPSLDLGTIFPGDLSTAKDREITGHSTKVVTLTEATEVSVWAFGYNDDTSANGGGRAVVTASVVASVV